MSVCYVVVVTDAALDDELAKLCLEKENTRASQDLRTRSNPLVDSKVRV